MTLVVCIIRPSKFVSKTVQGIEVLAKTLPLGADCHGLLDVVFFEEKSPSFWGTKSALVGIRTSRVPSG